MQTRNEYIVYTKSSSRHSTRDSEEKLYKSRCALVRTSERTRRAKCDRQLNLIKRERYDDRLSSFFIIFFSHSFLLLLLLLHAGMKSS